MIEFYTWFTPNGRKVAILLEELGIDYNVHSVNIGK
ncbi:MAG: glutathione S-transferase, partial [Alphaproteobacteria bacterium]